MDSVGTNGVVSFDAIPSVDPRQKSKRAALALAQQYDLGVTLYLAPGVVSDSSNTLRVTILFVHRVSVQYQRTKVIEFTPRFIFVNDMKDRSICYTQMRDHLKSDAVVQPAAATGQQMAQQSMGKFKPVTKSYLDSGAVEILQPGGGQRAFYAWDKFARKMEANQTGICVKFEDPQCEW